MPAIITRINPQTNNKILLPVIKEKQRQKTTNKNN